MNILFLHQNFPGQYRQILDWLIAQKSHNLVFLTQRKLDKPTPGVNVVRYAPHHMPKEETYGLIKYTEECMGTGFGAAVAAEKLKRSGFTPDVILGHIGWGELTFIKQIWPDVPVLGYYEYFYLAKGGLVGFDPEFPATDHTPFIMHSRNAINWMSPGFVDLGQSPTQWQMDTFPEQLRSNLYMCHDGIRTDRLVPNEDPAPVVLGRSGITVKRGDEVFTYMARNMEPTRGFHIFMRSLPNILAARPNARVLVIGGNEVSYGRKSDTDGGYRGEMEREIGDRVDWDRVHFLGRVSYNDFQKCIQISRCHIYLTMPFVLSWSLLESMSMGATIVASDTAPVREAIEHGKTGLLVDFFSPEKLAAQVVEVLERPDDFAHLGVAAREIAVRKYDFLTHTLKVHLDQINSLVPRKKWIEYDLPG